jgi:hypothetical protein
MALLLLHRHATVTICHSRTPDLPGVEGMYGYNHFSRHLRLKAIRGTSDVHRGPADDFINDRTRIYALRYNRVVLGWTEKYHPDWLGPRESLTR